MKASATPNVPIPDLIVFFAHGEGRGASQQRGFGRVSRFARARARARVLRVFSSREAVSDGKKMSQESSRFRST